MSVCKVVIKQLNATVLTYALGNPPTNNNFIRSLKLWAPVDDMGETCRMNYRDREVNGILEIIEFIPIKFLWLWIADVITAYSMEISVNKNLPSLPYDSLLYHYCLTIPFSLHPVYPTRQTLVVVPQKKTTTMRCKSDLRPSSRDWHWPCPTASYKPGGSVKNQIDYYACQNKRAPHFAKTLNINLKSIDRNQTQKQSYC